MPQKATISGYRFQKRLGDRLDNSIDGFRPLKLSYWSSRARIQTSYSQLDLIRKVINALLWQKFGPEVEKALSSGAFLPSGRSLKSALLPGFDDYDTFLHGHNRRHSESRCGFPNYCKLLGNFPLLLSQATEAMRTPVLPISGDFSLDRSSVLPMPVHLALIRVIAAETSSRVLEGRLASRVSGREGRAGQLVEEGLAQTHQARNCQSASLKV